MKDNTSGKRLMVFGLVLGLAACSGSQQSPAPAPAVAASTASAESADAAWEEDHPDEVTPPRSAAELSAAMLHKVLTAPGRSEAARKLDDVRHPAATLAFFGLRPDMSVIEVEPRDDWYAAILAPLLKANGTYSIALVSSLADAAAAKRMQSLRAALETDPARFDRARLISFDPHTPNLGTPGSADMVLSFGGMHDWVDAGSAKVLLQAMFDVLRPGGVLGVVDNRAEADSDPADLKGSGYVMQQTVVKLATQAGFVLDSASPLHSAPADARDQKSPPADADRMTLRFVKPTKPASPTSA